MKRLMIAASVLAVVAVAGLPRFFGSDRGSSSDVRVSRLQIAPSPAAAPVLGANRDLAITADGSRIVYAGTGALFVRALDVLEPTPLKGLGSPNTPFLSADGQWIGFADGLTALKKVPIAGGSPETVAALDGIFRGAAWTPDGTIVFATTNTATGLQRIPSAGAEPITLTRPDRARAELDHVWPEVLPGGQAVLFTITPAAPFGIGAPDQAKVAVFDLRTGTQTTLIEGGSDAHYVSSGHLVYSAAGSLRAVGFDLARLAVVGTPAPIPQVETTTATALDLTVDGDGTLVYVPDVTAAAAPPVQRKLVWVDRRGQQTPIPAPPRVYFSLRLSPDGTKLAADLRDESEDIWVWDFARQALTRVTVDPASDVGPVWTADGQRVIFSTVRDGKRQLFWQAADGTGAPERLGDAEQSGIGPAFLQPKNVSPDGKWLLVLMSTIGDIGMLDLAGDRQLKPLIQTPFTEGNGVAISRDGRWIAYDSNETGRQEIYVRPFPAVEGAHRQISTNGGGRPMWSHDGRELLYLEPPGRMMAVALQPGASFSAGSPQLLFEGQYELVGGNAFDVTPDGRRFLMMTRASPPAPAPAAAPRSLVVVQNWSE